MTDTFTSVHVRLRTILTFEPNVQTLRRSYGVVVKDESAAKSVAVG